MTDPLVPFSREFIQQAKKERAVLLQQIQECQAIIEHSRELIARFDASIGEMERK
jgi:hypothetical protein